MDLNLNITNSIKKKACHKLQVIVKYQHTSKELMNSLKGMPRRESKPNFPVYFPDQTARSISHTDGYNLSKGIFFACVTCAGPLVPITICVRCRRTALRKCTKCGKTCEFNDHESCRNLIHYGSIIFNSRNIDN